MTEASGDGIRAGAPASYACAILTVAALAAGITIAVRLGAQSGVDVARADSASLSAIKPLLMAAEVLKIITGALIAVAVIAANNSIRVSRAALPLGLAGAAFLIAAGVLGFLAVGQLGRPEGTPELGTWTALAGLVSAPLTGLWAALLLPLQSSPAPRWLRITALILAASGVLALLLAPVGMIFGVASIIWWTGLGRLFGRLKIG